ncbi:SulP family inorganic anion transporter [Paenibacillus antri]|uniref:SulP family inorganic anion transporter n=1 Tax=Paenibacillus antri TaxID=2582848 RepID=A0A5R9GA25_9BACL|nr:SulP family inorganic anion transporter [Paenibacillus antri]TLS49563.1 SulP family inorganic anion transporter [Paenibacillus antri]
MTKVSPLRTFLRDATAGAIVAVLLVPQSMAYAMLAGAPPEAGLYAAALPLLVYAALGTSKHLSVGPASIVSLLAFAGVGALTGPGSPSHASLLTALSLSVGALLLLFGVLRVGRWVDRVDRSVIHGFISAAGIVICIQQIGPLAGVSIPREERFMSLFPAIVRSLDGAHLLTAAVGLLCLAALYGLHKALPIAIGPLAALLVAAAATKRFGLHGLGVDIVGAVPAGLPDLRFALPSAGTALDLLPTALAISLIVCFESYAVAASIAAKAGYPLRANRELIALGAANVASSVVGSVPVAGAMSRSAVNYASGARTKLAGAISAAFATAAVLYATELLYFIPKAAMAAVIVFSVARLIDGASLVSRGERSPRAYTILLLTFAATLAVGVFEGLLIGIAASLVPTALRKKR